MSELQENIEGRIRREVGRVILERAGLPIKVDGATFTRDITIQSYRKYFPQRDDLDTVYLTLTALKDEFVKKADYDGAARIRDALVELFTIGGENESIS